MTCECPLTHTIQKFHFHKAVGRPDPFLFLKGTGLQIILLLLQDRVKFSYMYMYTSRYMYLIKTLGLNGENID